jgi:hypothetical protein
MRPMRVRIDRIVDFGTIVSLIGADIDSAKPVTIHVDHRPFAAFWEAWREAGFPQPIEYAIDRLLLSLDMTPVDDDGEVRLTECDGVGMAIANDDHELAPEIEP